MKVDSGIINPLIKQEPVEVQQFYNDLMEFHELFENCKVLVKKVSVFNVTENIKNKLFELFPEITKKTIKHRSGVIIQYNPQIVKYDGKEITVPIEVANILYEFPFICDRVIHGVLPKVVADTQLKIISDIIVSLNRGEYDILTQYIKKFTEKELVFQNGAKFTLSDPYTIRYDSQKYYGNATTVKQVNLLNVAYINTFFGNITDPFGRFKE